MIGLAQALLAAAGLAGAAGVALAAVAAHKAESASLMTAAILLVLHAAASVGLVAVSLGSQSPRPLLLCGSVILFGAALFAGSVTLLTFHGRPLFPMSAPTGGMLMIAGWLALSVVALTFLQQR